MDAETIVARIMSHSSAPNYLALLQRIQLAVQMEIARISVSLNPLYGDPVSQKNALEPAP